MRRSLSRPVLGNSLPAAFPELVLLAAGRSRRLGRPKAAATREGQPLLLHQLLKARRAGFSRVQVVLGADGRRLAALLDARTRAALGFESLELVFVTGWREGMGGSLREALHRLRPGGAGRVLLLVDQVGVAAKDLRRLAMIHLGPGKQRLAAATVADHHLPQAPLLLARSHCAPLRRQLRGDRGLGGWLRALAPSALRVLPMAGLAQDLDTPTDAHRWRNAPVRATVR